MKICYDFSPPFLLLSLSPVIVAAASRPRAKPSTKVEDFVPEGDVDGFFEDDEEEEDTEDEEEDRYVRNALMCLLECFDVPIFSALMSIMVCFDLFPVDSDEDAQTGKPQIALDEDLSSPEEEEEEEAPPPAPPTVSKPSPQVTRPPVVLKSAKDIELTESEEEEETPDVMADEDVGDEDTAPALLTSKKTKDVLSGQPFMKTSYQNIEVKTLSRGKPSLPLPCNKDTIYLSLVAYFK